MSLLFNPVREKAAKKVFLDGINYASDGWGLVIICEGYWEQAVSQILAFLKNQLLEHFDETQELDKIGDKLKQLSALSDASFIQ